MSQQQQRSVTFAGEKMDFGSHPGMSKAVPQSLQGVVGQSRETANPTTSGGNIALSCTTCKEAFSSVEELRKHFDSEYHLSNVRRRVENEPLLDHAQFRRSGGATGNHHNHPHADRASISGASVTTTATDRGVPTPAPMFTCNLCKRTYKSAQTLQSHLKSTEHLIRKEQRIIERGSQAGSALSSTSLGSAAMGLHRRHKAHKHRQGNNAFGDDEHENQEENVIAPDGTTVITKKVSASSPTVSLEDREADVSPSRCFLCGFKSSTVKKNLSHMLDHHEFTIPLADRVTDWTSYMEYLSRKVNGCICFVCGENTKKYETLEALRGHMRSANHERIVLAPEYQEFYSCKLDDGTSSASSVIRKLDAISGLMVLENASGTKQYMPKNQAIPVGTSATCKASRETIVQKDERRMLTMQKVEENALILKQRLELEAPRLKEERKVAGNMRRQQQAHNMKISILENKLHRKGWDGNMEL